MTFKELMERLVEDGITSIKKYETRETRRGGGIIGFEICATIENPIEFPKIIEDRHKMESKMKLKNSNLNEFWEYRYATIQIEWCWEIVKVALGIYPQSARAVMKYAEIVGQRINP